MKSGIILLSFPFAAGVATAALAAEPFAGALASSAAVAVLTVACVLKRKDCRGGLILLYYFLGAFCWCSGALFPRPYSTPHATVLVDALERLLDGIPFDGDHSGAVIKALLTGRRSSLPRETVNVFRKSGAAHILALSGLHLGIIYGLLRKLLSPLGNSSPARLLKGTLTVALCGLYALATGASPSIVRAFLFICINEAGRSLSARAHSPLGTFCLALTLQLAVRPGLISSAGFQLSYLAMLGITLLFPRLRDWYPGQGKRDPVRLLWTSAALSVSCQAFTAPVAWYHFRSVPLFFLITNLIALPLTELLMIGAVAAVLLEAMFGCPPALSYACGKAVQLLEFCLETIASLSS